MIFGADYGSLTSSPRVQWDGGSGPRAPSTNKQLQHKNVWQTRNNFLEDLSLCRRDEERRIKDLRGEKTGRMAWERERKIRLQKKNEQKGGKEREKLELWVWEVKSVYHCLWSHQGSSAQTPKQQHVFIWRHTTLAFRHLSIHYRAHTNSTAHKPVGLLTENILHTATPELH